MCEGQNFVMHLGIYNKETEVNIWDVHSYQKWRSYSNIRVILYYQGMQN